MKKFLYAVCVLCASALLCSQGLCVEPNISTYTNYPIFQVNATPPNILIILDNSGSMNYAAYGTWIADGQEITDPYAGGTTSQTVEVRVSQSSDDAEERTTNGAMDRTSTILDLINSGTYDQVVGMRFQNVAIPQGATIASAYLLFKSAAKKTSSTSLTIYGEGSDNAQAFSTVAYNMSGRPNTTASVAWNSVPSWSSGTNYQSPDLTTIVQEIVNRGGWASGNSMAFKITGSGVRQAKSYDGDQPNAPLLHISYTYTPSVVIKYYGYFDPDARYVYSSNEFVRTTSTASDTWSGNWLNWLSMRRIDVLRKVLMGGLATSRTGGGNQTNIGETPAQTSRYYQKWFSNNGTGAASVSAYSGDRCYGIQGGYIYVGDSSTDSDPYSGYAARYNIRVKKDQANEPQDFYEGNLAGVLQRVGDKARWGNEFFNTGTGTGQSGGRVVSSIGTNMTSLITDLQNTGCDTNTPLAESYYVAMQYFKQEALQSGLDYPNNALPPFNAVNDPFKQNGQVIKCAKSFVLLLTDGAPTEDRKIPDVYKDYDNDGQDAPFGNTENADYNWCDDQPYNFGKCGSDYLDDIALYARTTDLRTDINGEQNLILYAVFAFGGTDEESQQGRKLLMDAARNGGFIDQNGNDRPDGTYTSPAEQRKEWDANGDGVPDTYFEATDGYELERKLIAAINDILKRAASGTAVSVLAQKGEGEGTLVQAYFKPSVTDGLNEIQWIGYLQSLWVDAYGNMREDSDSDKGLNVNTDRIIKFYLDSESGDTKVKRYDVSSNPYPNLETAPFEDLTLEEIHPLWEAGTRLAYRDADTRKIYTYIGSGSPAQPDAFDNSGECIEFTTSNAAALKPFFGVADDATWNYLGATYDNRASNLINFIRGVPDNSTDYTGSPQLRPRTIGGQLWKLGDIVYSTPVSISKAVENYGLLYDDASYRSFYDMYKDRETVIYVGANDGMLHAFTSGVYNATLKKFEPVTGTSEQIGDELWAYIPKCLLPHLKWLPYESYTHVSYVDLKPKVVDAKIFTPDDTHPNGWGTILLCGMNFGGKDITVAGLGTFYSSFAAIDITNPRSPRLLWEKWYDSLGLTISIPSVVKVHDQWFCIIGSGPTDFNGTSTHKGRVYIVDLSTGALRKYFETSENYAFMNSPVSLDKSLNYSVDAIYAGSTYFDSTWKGKVYKIAVPITNVPYTEGLDATYDTNPANWKWTALFTTPAPLTASFTMSVDNRDNVWIYLGTGRYIAQADKTDGQQNYIYGIKDPFYNSTGAYKDTCYRKYATSGCEFAASDIFAADPYKIKADGSIEVLAGGNSSITSFTKLIEEAQKKEGWYRTLISGTPSERVISKPSVFGGIALFPAFTPSSDVCGFGGNSNLYALYFETGTAYKKRVVGTLQQNTPAILDVMYLGEGLSSSFGIHSGKQEGGTIYGQQSTGVIVEVDVLPAINVKSGTVYWREGR